MECVCCGSAAVTERPGRTARGYRRFRCRDCGKQSNERSGGSLNHTHYPSDVIALVVLWRLRHRLTLPDPDEVFLVRGLVLSHEAVRDWEAKLAPALADELRRRRHGKGGARGRHWHVDETYIKVRGRWVYLYRAIDRDGNLADVMLSEHRDMAAAQALFRSARAVTGITPDRVTTDGHGSYPRAIRSTLGRRVVHRTSAYKNLWPAPSASSSAIRSDQSTPTYPVSGPSPGQDGDPHVPVLITTTASTTASSATSCSRIPERRSTVRPSRFHRPQTSSAARAGRARATDPVRYDIVAALVSNPRPLRSTAQTIRASSAASATTTVFTCARASGPRNHPPSGVSPLEIGRASCRERV